VSCGKKSLMISRSRRLIMSRSLACCGANGKENSRRGAKISPTLGTASRNEKDSPVELRMAKRQSAPTSRESNLKIEFKLCGKAANEKRHAFEINLISFAAFAFRLNVHFACATPLPRHRAAQHKSRETHKAQLLALSQRDRASP
jgi:hypothetical protein